MADLSNSELLNLVRSKNLRRFDIDRGQANEIMDRMGDWVSLMESDRNPDAKNPDSTAAGAYQYTQGAIKTAVNRLENTIGSESLPEWAKDVRKSGDARDLTLEQQKILFEADTFQKPGSDKILRDVFTGDEGAVIDLYKKLHHTSPDKSTLTRIDNLRPQLQLPQFQPQDTFATAYAEPKPRPQLASDMVELTGVPRNKPKVPESEDSDTGSLLAGLRDAISSFFSEDAPSGYLDSTDDSRKLTQADQEQFSNLMNRLTLQGK